MNILEIVQHYQNKSLNDEAIIAKLFLLAAQHELFEDEQIEKGDFQMDKEVLKAINDLAKRINEVQQKMDAFAIQLSDKNKAEIDYIAMMEEIEIPESEVIENE